MAAGGQAEGDHPGAARLHSETDEAVDMKMRSGYDANRIAQWSNYFVGSDGSPGRFLFSGYF